MNWYVYLLPAFSIYLIVISYFAGRLLEGMVDSLQTDRSEVKASKDIIKDVAKDWASRLSFVNSMALVLVSFLSIFSKTKNDWVLVVLVFHTMEFAAIFLWIQKHPVGDLIGTLRRFGIRDSTVCRSAILVANAVLIVTIYCTGGK